MPVRPGASVTRSEEELTVSTRVVAAGRLRVSKRIVRSTETRTVEVRREELVVERIDLPAEAVASAGALEPSEPLEVVLLQEELVLSTRVVPYERVRVHKDLVTEQHPIQETLRKERVDVQEPMQTEREDPR